MKNIFIKSINLINWRGQNLSVDFSENTEIRGENRSGKSSVYNAFLWLLTGTDEYNRANYQLFDNTVDYDKDNSVPAIVEAVFNIDGVDYKLKKTATIGWIRKKGRTEWERKGTDDYTFSIDDVDRNATQYKAFIEEVFMPIEKLKIALNIRYFLSLDWQVKRKYLADMVGEINMSDYQGEYGNIEDDLKKYSIDELKARYKTLIKPIKEKINVLPKTIETLVENLSDVSCIEDAENEIESAKKQIEKIDAAILDSTKYMDDIAKRRQESISLISTLNEEYTRNKNLYESEYRRQITKLEEEKDLIITKYQSEKAIKDSRMPNVQKELKLAEELMVSLLKTDKKLREELELAKSVEFVESECPYCGQKLPLDKLEENKEKFNTEKQSNIEIIINNGKANNTKIKNTKEDIDRLKKEIESLSENSIADTTNIDAKIAEIKASFIQYEETTEAKEIIEKIRDIKANMPNVEAPDNSNLIAMKNNLLKSIEENSKKLGYKEIRKSQEEKIEELKQELKSNAVELAVLEGKLDSVVEFEREKASIVNNRVNNLFSYIKIKMQEQNKSGDYVDTCNIFDNDGVISSVTNTANNMLCGIDIATSFCKFHKISLPLFVDNAEAINECNFPKVDGQVIKLIVADEQFNVKNL